MLKLKITVKYTFKQRVPFWVALRAGRCRRRKYLERLGIGVTVSPKKCYIIKKN